MDVKELNEIAKIMVAPKKGILAADESTGTIKKRLDTINVESTEDNRRNWRQLLFQTKSISDYISGVILYDETLRQNTSDGISMVDLLSSKGILSGIKVDKSTHDLALSKGEVLTEGLDGLRERLTEYRELGAKFTKWRAVININDKLPTEFAINVNSILLSIYASLSQESGLVPIVEPEVLMDGDHSIEKCAETTEKTLLKVFEDLVEANVNLSGIVLKPNMVLSGKDAQNRASTEEVAKYTVEVLKNTVPADVPGIAFLSGGQEDQESIDNLNSINIVGAEKKVPWELSYSYGRGLQGAPLKIWGGENTKVSEAQKEFEKRGIAVSLARQGKY
jgi:fructose-bisphosphate aldolase class I